MSQRPDRSPRPQYQLPGHVVAELRWCELGMLLQQRRGGPGRRSSAAPGRPSVD